MNKKEKNKKMKKLENLETVHAHTRYSLKDEKSSLEKRNLQSGVTLIALIITILFSYDEKLKCSNSKGFLLQTI